MADRGTAGEAEESLSARISGDAVLVWYSDDNVFHERCLLWPGRDDHWAVPTPDNDVYVEDLSCKGGRRTDAGGAPARRQEGASPQGPRALPVPRVACG